MDLVLETAGILEGSGITTLTRLESAGMEGWTQTDSHIMGLDLLLHVLWSYTGIAAFEGAPPHLQHIQHGCGVGSEVIYSCVLLVHRPQAGMEFVGFLYPKYLAEVTKDSTDKVSSLIRI